MFAINEHAVKTSMIRT